MKKPTKKEYRWECYEHGYTCGCYPTEPGESWSCGYMTHATTKEKAIALGKKHCAKHDEHHGGLLRKKAVTKTVWS